MDPLFQVYRLNEQGLDRAGRIAEAFDGLLSILYGMCPVNTREFSLVKTKLEEACFFAKKSIANLVDNQQPDTKAKSA